MVRVVALVVGLALAAGAAGAVNKWVGVGDSIMVGSTWPVTGGCSICGAIFDCSGGCGLTPAAARDQCGIVRRLDVFLGGGAANYVKNLGIGGESTAEGVARLPSSLDGECGTPGDCIAMILMHGTNDMYGGVPPATAAFNVQTMIGQARARNIDTLLMTIIRRINDPSNLFWSAYHDLIVALAATENVPRVDPYVPLCPDTTCFNTNYWVANSCFAGNPGELEVGHPDPDGYNIMGNLVTAAFPGSVPAGPTTTSPAGDIGDTTPDFVWPEVAGARWYALEVDAATTTWWEAAAHCAAGTCTANPGVALAKSAHSWRVRGRNLRGLGSWSAVTPFEIWGVPGKPVGSAPMGTFQDVDPLSPPFGWEPYTWSKVTDATLYDLEVEDGGVPVLQQTFAASICSGSTCSARPGAGLAEGSYTWTVQGRNPGATGAPSAAKSFDVDHLPPAAPMATGPTGELFEMAPRYEWLATAGATEYDLEVKDSGGAVDAQATGLSAAAVCVAGFCSHVEGTMLGGPDSYTLRVRGQSAGGVGPYSAPGAGFTVIACADASATQLQTQYPSPLQTAETLSHCGAVSAAMTAPYTIDSTGDLTIHTRDGFSAYSGFTVIGDLAVKSP